jgi:FKBP-type peptidyl-prolyl cis-trans isomerase
LSALVPSEFKQYEQFREQGQIYEVQPGTGAEVKAGSMVTVNYRGWLTNGQLFDESYSRGQPFVFKEGEHRVISGWEQGLLGAKAGAKRRLVLPPAFGYGDQAHDPIPANSMLIFDVEVVAVQ